MIKKIKNRSDLSYPISFFLSIQLLIYLLNLRYPLFKILIVIGILCILICCYFFNKSNRLSLLSYVSLSLAAIFFSAYLSLSSTLQRQETPIYDDLLYGYRFHPEPQFFLYEATLEGIEFKKDHWRLSWSLAKDTWLYSITDRHASQEELLALLSPQSQYYIYAQLLPFEASLNPSDFDLRENAYRKALSYRAKIKGIYLKEKHWRFDWAQRLLAFNLSLRAKWSVFGRGGELYNGLIFGDYSLSQQDRNAFNQTGIAHLLSVSGFHVTLIAWFLIKIFDWIFVYLFHLEAPRQWSILLTLPMLWIFIWMAQAPICALRAGEMLSFALIAQFFLKKLPALEACSLSAILLLNPIDLFFDISLQLSFTAVYALLLWTGKGQKSMLWSVLEVSIVAFLATAPLQAYHFGTCSLYAIFFNCILTPIGGVILMPLGVLALLVSPIHSAPMLWVSTLGEWWIQLTVACAEFSQGERIVGQAFAWVLASISVGILLLIYSQRRLSQRLVLALLCFCLGWSLYLLYKIPKHGLTWIAVGQGNATLLRGEKSFALIDTGPKSQDFQLIHFLKKAGIKRLDWILITHWHPDHDGGLIALLESGIELGAIHYHGGRLIGESREHLKQSLRERHIPLLAVQQGKIQWDGLSLSYLWGEAQTKKDLWERPELGENDLSVPLLIESQQQERFLLSGDLENYGEAKLIASLEGLVPSLAERPIRLFQLNHHGSRTSSHPLLLRALNAKYAVVSLGKNHHFAFPHNEVLIQLKKTILLRTDQSMVSIDFNRIQQD